MKKRLLKITLLLSAFAAMASCNKFGQLPGQSANLVASSYKVAINQPDSLLLTTGKSTDSVTWSVTPSGFDSLITKNNKALIFFKKAGTYSVKAVDKISGAGTVSISVSDSVYHPTIQYVFTPLTGDQITLVPHYVASGDSTYISFVAQTKNYYCSTGILQLTDSVKNNQYFINFIRVWQQSPCTIGETPIAAVINFTANQPAPLPAGSFPLTVTLNGTTYTGTIQVTATTISFNWNYTSGGLILPTQISR